MSAARKALGTSSSMVWCDAINPMLDLTQLRADTPGTHDVIRFNNAGASLMPQVVLDTITHHLRQEARLGGYEAAGRWSNQPTAI